MTFTQLLQRIGTSIHLEEFLDSPGKGRPTTSTTWPEYVHRFPKRSQFSRFVEALEKIGLGPAPGFYTRHDLQAMAVGMASPGGEYSTIRPMTVYRVVQDKARKWTLKRSLNKKVKIWLDKNDNPVAAKTGGLAWFWAKTIDFNPKRGLVQVQFVDDKIKVWVPEAIAYGLNTGRDRIQTKLSLRKGHKLRKTKKADEKHSVVLLDGHARLGYIFRCKTTKGWEDVFVPEQHTTYITKTQDVKTHKIMDRSLVKPDMALMLEGRRIVKLIKQDTGREFLTRPLFNKHSKRYTAAHAEHVFGNWSEFIRRLGLTKISSGAEETFISTLQRDTGVLFERRKSPGIDNLRAVVDAINHKLNLVVEYDGTAHQSDFLYGDKKRQQAIKTKMSKLKKAGYRVFVFTEGKTNYKQFVNRIKTYIEQQSQ